MIIKRFTKPSIFCVNAVGSFGYSDPVAGGITKKSELIRIIIISNMNSRLLLKYFRSSYLTTVPT
jgi:hypothetical protein